MRVVPLSQQVFSFENLAKELDESSVGDFLLLKDAYVYIQRFFGDSGTLFCRATSRHIFCGFLVSEMTEQVIFDLRNQTELALLGHGQIYLLSGTLDKFVDAFEKFTSFDSYEHRLLFTKIGIYLQQAGFTNIILSKVDFLNDGTYSTSKTTGRKVPDPGKARSEEGTDYFKFSL
jgi:hypothetical protein